MSKSNSTSALVGKVLGTLIQNGLIVWAMFETTGTIHAVLVGYVALLAFIYVVSAVLLAAKNDAEAKRPAYGDVHVNIKGDASQFTDAMARSKRSIDGFSR